MATESQIEAIRASFETYEARKAAHIYQVKEYKLKVKGVIEAAETLSASEKEALSSYIEEAI